MMNELQFTELVGRTLKSIENLDDERVVFTTDDGQRFDLYHLQDCCESVKVDAIVGDIVSVLGTPILAASKWIYKNETPEGMVKLEYEESYTWTVFTVTTATGVLVIRWLGESNGYYSESVYFGRT